MKVNIYDITFKAERVLATCTTREQVPAAKRYYFLACDAIDEHAASRRIAREMKRHLFDLVLRMNKQFSIKVKYS